MSRAAPLVIAVGVVVALAALPPTLLAWFTIIGGVVAAVGWGTVLTRAVLPTAPTRRLLSPTELRDTIHVTAQRIDRPAELR